MAATINRKEIDRVVAFEALFQTINRIAFQRGAFSQFTRTFMALEPHELTMWNLDPTVREDWETCFNRETLPEEKAIEASVGFLEMVATWTDAPGISDHDLRGGGFIEQCNVIGTPLQDAFCGEQATYRASGAGLVRFFFSNSKEALMVFVAERLTGQWPLKHSVTASRVYAMELKHSQIAFNAREGLNQLHEAAKYASWIVGSDRLSMFALGVSPFPAGPSDDRLVAKWAELWGDHDESMPIRKVLHAASELLSYAKVSKHENDLVLEQLGKLG